MNLIEWLRDRWYERCRRLDMELLWPECCAQTTDLDMAKAAFAVHAFQDPAWRHLGKKGTFMIIDSLVCPADSQLRTKP